MKTFKITQTHLVMAETAREAAVKLAKFDSDIAERMAMIEEGEIEIVTYNISEVKVKEASG